MPRILQTGFPRSGNTLLWKILSHVQQSLGQFRSFSVDSGFRQVKAFYEQEKLIHREDAEVDKFSMASGALAYVYPNEDMRSVRVSPALFLEYASLLFTHDEPSLFLDAPGFERIELRFYVVRDPRPVYVSLCHHAVRPAILRLLPSMKLRSLHAVMARDDLTVGWAERWKRHVRDYLDHRARFELVRYESLVGDKRETLSRLVARIAPKVDEAQREQIVDSTLEVTDFQSMQAASPEHVRKGGSDAWTAEIPDPARRIVEEIARDEMEALGYLDASGPVRSTAAAPQPEPAAR